MASITDAPVYPRVEVRPTQEGYSVVARKGTMHIATYVALGPELLQRVAKAAAHGAYAIGLAETLQSAR